MSFDKMSTDEIIKKPFIKPDETPQPHFIPGYTGFCPELSRVVGASYARVTNEILKDRPEIANRLRPTETRVAHPQKVYEAEEEQAKKDKRLINSRFPTVGRKVLNDYMMPGYGGHVPNIADAVGVSYSKGCVKSISKFLREQVDDKDGKSL